MNEAEKLAAAESSLSGYGLKVLDRKYTSAHGTADIIAEQRGELVVVSVVGALPRYLSGPRRSRLRMTGIDWMNGHGRRYDRLRVDLVAVRLEGTGGYVVDHAKALG